MTRHAIQINNQLYKRYLEQKNKSEMISYRAREKNNKSKKKEYDLYKSMSMKLNMTKRIQNKKKHE